MDSLQIIEFALYGIKRDLFSVVKIKNLGNTTFNLSSTLNKIVIVTLIHIILGKQQYENQILSILTNSLEFYYNSR